MVAQGRWKRPTWGRSLALRLAPAIRSILILGFGIVVAGCAGGIAARSGRYVDPTKLDQVLIVGRSTQSDVLAVLGKPLGTGQAMFPWQAGQRTQWYYYYEESTLEPIDGRRLFVFTYFDGDKLDGYMWFSSLLPPYPQMENPARERP